MTQPPVVLMVPWSLTTYRFTYKDALEDAAQARGDDGKQGANGGIAGFLLAVCSQPARLLCKYDDAEAGDKSHFSFGFFLPCVSLRPELCSLSD